MVVPGTSEHHTWSARPRNPSPPRNSNGDLIWGCGRPRSTLTCPGACFATMDPCEGPTPHGLGDKCAFKYQQWHQQPQGQLLWQGRSYSPHHQLPMPPACYNGGHAAALAVRTHNPAASSRLAGAAPSSSPSRGSQQIAAVALGMRGTEGPRQLKTYTGKKPVLSVVVKDGITVFERDTIVTEAHCHLPLPKKFVREYFPHVIETCNAEPVSLIILDDGVLQPGTLYGSIRPQSRKMAISPGIDVLAIHRGWRFCGVAVDPDLQGQDGTAMVRLYFDSSTADKYETAVGRKWAKRYVLQPGPEPPGKATGPKHQQQQGPYGSQQQRGHGQQAAVGQLVEEEKHVQGASSGVRQEAAQVCMQQQLQLDSGDVMVPSSRATGSMGGGCSSSHGGHMPQHCRPAAAGDSSPTAAEPGAVPGDWQQQEAPPGPPTGLADGQSPSAHWSPGGAGGGSGATGRVQGSTGRAGSLGSRGPMGVPGGLIQQGSHSEPSEGQQPQVGVYTSMAVVAAAAALAMTASDAVPQDEVPKYQMHQGTYKAELRLPMQLVHSQLADLEWDGPVRNVHAVVYENGSSTAAAAFPGYVKKYWNRRKARLMLGYTDFMQRYGGWVVAGVGMVGQDIVQLHMQQPDQDPPAFKLEEVDAQAKGLGGGDMFGELWEPESGSPGPGQQAVSNQRRRPVAQQEGAAEEEQLSPLRGKRRRPRSSRFAGEQWLVAGHVGQEEQGQQGWTPDDAVAPEMSAGSFGGGAGNETPAGGGAADLCAYEQAGPRRSRFAPGRAARVADEFGSQGSFGSFGSECSEGGEEGRERRPPGEEGMQDVEIARQWPRTAAGLAGSPTAHDGTARGQGVARSSRLARESHDTMEWDMGTVEEGTAGEKAGGLEDLAVTALQQMKEAVTLPQAQPGVSSD